MSDLFSSLLIFTRIKTILSTFFYCFQILQKSCKMSVDRGVWRVAGTTTLDREWVNARVRVKIRVRIKVRVTVRIKVRVRVKVMVMIRVGVR